MKLENKTFFNLRPKCQAAELSELLKSEAARVIEMPCIEICPINVGKDSTLADLIVFTSSNGIRIAHQQSLISKNQLIACIGDKSKKCAEDLSYSVSFIPERADSLSFANELLGFLEEKNEIKTIALLRAKVSDPILAKILEKNAYVVKDIPVYKTNLPKYQPSEIESMLRHIDKLSMNIFSSSAMLKNFISLLDGESQKKILQLPTAVIGVKTRETAEKLGFNTIIMPQKACIKSLVNEILGFFSK